MLPVQCAFYELWILWFVFLVFSLSLSFSGLKLPYYLMLWKLCHLLHFVRIICKCFVCMNVHHLKHLCTWCILHLILRFWKMSEKKHLFQDKIKTQNLHLKQLKIKCSHHDYVLTINHCSLITQAISAFIISVFVLRKHYYENAKISFYLLLH